MMQERDLRRLRPEITDQLLPLAQKVTGKKPVIYRVKEIPARAMMISSQIPDEPWEICVRTGQQDIEDHLIARELGRIIRVGSVPENERLALGITPESVGRARYDFTPFTTSLRERGLPEENIEALFQSSMSILTSQLASAPTSLRIEKWIYDNYPGLREVQKQSLVQQALSYVSLFTPRIKATTPPDIYNATMVMYGTLVWQTAALFERPELLEPFQKQGVMPQVRYLAAIALRPEEAGEENYRSDMKAAKAWAEELGLIQWFRWKKI